MQKHYWHGALALSISILAVTWAGSNEPEGEDPLSAQDELSLLEEQRSSDYQLLRQADLTAAERRTAMVEFAASDAALVQRMEELEAEIAAQAAQEPDPPGEPDPPLTEDEEAILALQNSISEALDEARASAQSAGELRTLLRAAQEETEEMQASLEFLIEAQEPEEVVPEAPPEGELSVMEEVSVALALLRSTATSAADLRSLITEFWELNHELLEAFENGEFDTEQPEEPTQE